MVSRHGDGPVGLAPPRAARSLNADHLLRSSRQIPELDLAVRQLVADDDREVGLVAGGGLQLLAELALAELRTRRDPLATQQCRDAQPFYGRSRIRADHDGRRRIGGRRAVSVALLLVECQEQPVEPDPEPDAGRGPAAEQLDEAVVAAATTDRLLLALAPLDIELERGPRVVVETADQPGLDPVRDAEGVEMRAHGSEMRGTGLAQTVGDARRRRVDRRHRRILRVGQPKHVPLEAVAFGRRQCVRVGPVIGGQLLDVGRPARLVTDRVEQHLDALDAGVAIEAHAELDDLGIDGRSRVADRLDVELPELAVATGLWAVVPEHRPDLEHLDRLRPGLHPVLDIRPDDAGGRLGSQRP